MSEAVPEGFATVEELLKAGVDALVVSKAAAATEAQMKKMSRPGALDLPPMLEEKRLQYLITDGAFKVHPAFDRILVWQIAAHQKETFDPQGTIIMPDMVRDQEKMVTPRGVIVSAGLLALDHLRSNCIDVGHTVYFVQNAPWRICVDGHPYYVMVLRDGDLIGSEDTQEAVRKGNLKVTYNKDTGQHVYADPDGNILGTPTLPWISPDY